MIFRILWIKANIIYTQKHTHTYLCIHIDIFGLPWRLSGKNLPASAGDRGNMVQSLGQENPLEKEMATHSSIWSLVGYSLWVRSQAQFSD